MTECGGFQTMKRTFTYSSTSPYWKSVHGGLEAQRPWLPEWSEGDVKCVFLVLSNLFLFFLVIDSCMLILLYNICM